MIYIILLVGVGGWLGSMARYICQRWVSLYYPHHFPWGTFAVNIIGCFVIGIIWGISFRSFETNEQWKLFLMTGICGGFTTFSSFTLESIGLLKEQRAGLFFLYMAGSVLVGLAATYAGMKLIR